ncbi:unnamed protein product [Anisakis simplex]|uniref:ING domain-containing protein n=1 Tax=Anisakis simplex TaxID=6269 RepID=A0A0M3JDX5_ANISI|nr:unnamed protein product [Anisakis simplex]
MEDDDGCDKMNADKLSAIQLDELDKTVVVNRCYMDFLGQLTRRIDSLLAGNRREQALLKRKIHSVEDLENDNEANRKSASPAMFFPPYFKDTSGMVSLKLLPFSFFICCFLCVVSDSSSS